MDTELLMGGALSPRKKGDLFWKKYKLMEQAESVLCDGAPSKIGEKVARDAVEKYKDATYLIDSDLDGNEFRPFPPTATGRELRVAGLVRAMRAASDDKCDKELSVALSNALKLYFNAAGYEENSVTKISDDAKEKAEDMLDEAVKAYETVFFKASGQKVEKRKETDSSFEKKRLSKTAFSSFSKHLPENYWGQLNNGSLKADAYYDKSAKEETLAAVTITGSHDGWRELVWVSVEEAYMEEEKIKSIIESVIEDTRAQEDYVGVFLEMHVVEQTPEMQKILEAAGLTVYIADDNMYEFSFSELCIQDSFYAIADKIPCLSVNLSSEKAKESIENTLMSETNPIPVAIPVPWTTFRDDLSFICEGSGKNDSGLLLVSQKGQSLVVELMYGQDPKIVAALLGSVCKKAKEMLDPSQNILVPIVNESTRPLVQKLAPSAARGKIAETLIWF